MNFFVPDRSSDESRRTENRNEQAREPPRGLTSRVGGGGWGRAWEHGAAQTLISSSSVPRSS